MQRVVLIKISSILAFWLSLLTAICATSIIDPVCWTPKTPESVQPRPTVFKHCYDAVKKILPDPQTVHKPILFSRKPDRGFDVPRQWRSESCIIMIDVHSDEDEEIATFFDLAAGAALINIGCVARPPHYGGTGAMGENRRMNYWAQFGRGDIDRKVDLPLLDFFKNTNCAILSLKIVMPSRKFNEYLDAGSSDDDGSSSHASDDLSEKKGRNPTSTKSSSKRQKIEHDSSDEASDSDPEFESPKRTTPDPNTSPPAQPTTGKNPPSPAISQPKAPVMKPSGITRKPPKPGVLYLSRIPPFMRPSALRHLLLPYGPIKRLFLTPEPPAHHTRRVRHGGNKKRSFIDGWVEFVSHKSAKTCVAAINGQTMGGRGWYRDDVWNAKYLRGFLWDDLMAGVRGEEREREERVRVGVRRERKEREAFLRGVESGKVAEGRRKKREKKEGLKGDGDGVGEEARGGFERRFRQNAVKGKRDGKGQSEEASRVLSKIF
ncbi:MAG: hypothetical protein Q9220_002788 [cf. Caloplaca sp. 1 TL-2023]